MSLTLDYIRNPIHIYEMNNNSFVDRIGVYLFLLWVWNHPTKPHWMSDNWGFSFASWNQTAYFLWGPFDKTSKVTDNRFKSITCSHSAVERVVYGDRTEVTTNAPYSHVLSSTIFLSTISAFLSYVPRRWQLSNNGSILLCFILF